MFPLILRTNLQEWKINLSDTFKNDFHCNFLERKLICTMMNSIRDTRSIK